MSNKNGYAIYINKNVFIRTVTHHYTGKLIKVFDDTILLENAAWIADDGILSEFLKDPKMAKDVEMYKNPVLINTGAACDLTEIPYLPNESK